MAFVTIDCPFCLSKHTSFSVDRLQYLQGATNGDQPARHTHQAVGTCGSCRSYALLYFEIKTIRYAEPIENYQFPSDAGDVRKLFDRKQGAQLLLVGQRPRPPSPFCPEHTPENVRKAFIEAENSLLANNYSAAAAFYGKAIDRAITPLVDEKVKRGMLGSKLGNLEGKSILPEAMIKWIKVVKKDRNFALHDDDRDFETAEEVERARVFARTLLFYLFTLPEIARTALDESGSAD